MIGFFLINFSQDLFYISPFYHLVFPMEKFLITDADIQFVYNINLLYDEFEKFGETKLYAFAKDMSPLYRTLVYEYRYISLHKTIFYKGFLYV